MTAQKPAVVPNESVTLPYAELKSVGRADRLAGDDPARHRRAVDDCQTAPGHSFPLGVAARGMVLLALAPEPVREQVLVLPLMPYTQHTDPDPDVLRAKIAEIAQRGYAVIQDDLVVGVGSAAAPIRGTDGGVSACVSLVLRTPRLRDDAVRERALAIAMSSAEKISLGLGWRPGAGRSSPA